MSGKDKRAAQERASLAAIEAEIAAAPPSTSTAATTRLSLADAVWKIPKDIPMSLRDRVVVTVAAEAVQALCETGLDGASLAVTLGIRQALRRLGYDKNVRAVAGYVVGRSPGTDRGAKGSPTATAHTWLEVDGRVLDVASDGLALCEAARRVGVDYSDPAAMGAAFSSDVLALGEYSPDARRALTVLNVDVPVGGTRTTTLPRGLTLATPPDDVAGAAEAVALTGRYAAVLGDDDPEAWVGEMPAEVRMVYERIAGIQLETVEHESVRDARLREAT